MFGVNSLIGLYFLLLKVTERVRSNAYKSIHLFLDSLSVHPITVGDKISEKCAWSFEKIFKLIRRTRILLPVEND